MALVESGKAGRGGACNFTQDRVVLHFSTSESDNVVILFNNNINSHRALILVRIPLVGNHQHLANMKSILAAGALFLPAALGATDTLFTSISDPACGPCLHKVVADGPGNIQTKEFANYLCLGKGGSAVAVCMTQCGSASSSDDALDIAYKRAQINLIIGVVFDYWYAHSAIASRTVVSC